MALPALFRNHNELERQNTPLRLHPRNRRTPTGSCQLRL